MEEKATLLISIANELEALIEHYVPNCSRVSKYGGTLFTLRPDLKEGQFCGVFIYSNHVQLSISRGAELLDERRVLSGTGKHRKHVNFTKLGEIDAGYLGGLIEQAAKLSIASE